MNAETKIRNAFCLIEDFFTDADDVTRNYLGVTEKQCEALLNCRIDLYTQEQSYGMQTFYNPKTHHSILSYDPDLYDALDQDMVTREVAQKAAYILNYNSNSIPNKIRHTSPYRLLSFAFSSKNYQDIALPLSAATVPLAYFFPPILLANIPPLLILHDMRNAGIRDIISADKIIPEIPYGSLYKACITALGLAPVEPVLEGLTGLFNPGVSNEWATQESAYNCPIFLETKKELGIPSMLPTNSSHYKL